MSEPYLVSLAGFTQFERDALAYCFGHTGTREPTYRLVDGLSKHDFVVADGDSHAIVGPLARDGHFHRTVFVGGLAAPDARFRVSRPIDPARILTILDDLATQRRAHHVSPVPWDPGEDRRWAARAAARVASRRARLKTAAPVSGLVAAPHAVLVLDEQGTDREHLCALLAAFGFRPCPAQSAGQAVQLIAQQSFEAAFLGLEPNDAGAGDAGELCRHIRQAESTASACPAVVVVCGTQQADRVRAALVGGDAVMTKPLARGDVARALDICSVRLPADPRRT